MRPSTVSILAAIRSPKRVCHVRQSVRVHHPPLQRYWQLTGPSVCCCPIPMTWAPSPTINSAFAAGRRHATFIISCVCSGDSFCLASWPGRTLQSSAGTQLACSALPTLTTGAPALRRRQLYSGLSSAFQHRERIQRETVHTSLEVLFNCHFRIFFVPVKRDVLGIRCWIRTSSQSCQDPSLK